MNTGKHSNIIYNPFQTQISKCGVQTIMDKFHRICNRNKAIGKWTMNNQTEKGNGGNLITTCIENDLICSNAHFIPKMKIKLISPPGTVLTAPRKDK